jgi:hypothetical protein
MGDSVEWRRLNRYQRVVSIQGRAMRHECEVTKRSLAQVQIKSKTLQQCGERTEQPRGRGGNICKMTRDFLSRLEEAKVTLQAKEVTLTQELSHKVMKYKSVERRIDELGSLQLKEKEKIKERLEQDQLDEVIPHSDLVSDNPMVNPFQNTQPVVMTVLSSAEHHSGARNERPSRLLDSFPQDTQGSHPAQIVLVETRGGVIRVENREAGLGDIRGMGEVMIRSPTKALQGILEDHSNEIRDALLDIGVGAFDVVSEFEE